MNDQANAQKVQDLYAAFGRGDIDTILANVSDEVTWGTETEATEVPWYPIRRGREQVADFFATLAREVEFTKFNPYQFVGAGDDVLVSLDIDYRLRKNGRSASIGAVHRFTMRDGVVQSFRTFEDTASVRAAWAS
ncbi:MAG TPA: nuclear transport factor 2 family protein [Thermoanaerobaculia bacterium]|nr:nuclear transport factor 2 family protein [Thermoanaerobaculia bacterium]